LSKAATLDKMYESHPFHSSIIIILHGNSVKFFARSNARRYRNLMKRAESLTHGGTIEFRMCLMRARLSGYRPRDIQGFVKMVPMADAEIVRLQKKGYAYMYTH